MFSLIIHKIIKKKAQISIIVYTTRFRNNLYQERSKTRDWKAKINLWRQENQRTKNRRATIGLCYICLGILNLVSVPFHSISLIKCCLYFFLAIVTVKCGNFGVYIFLFIEYFTIIVSYENSITKCHCYIHVVR